MTQYDLAGNPLPGGGGAQQYDLAGNPIAPQGAPMGGGGGGAYAPPGMGAPAVQYDLAGNPLPVQQAPPSYGGAPQYGAPGPQGAPYGAPGQQGGPYGGPGQQGGPYGGPGRAAPTSGGNTKAIGVGIGVLIGALVLGGIVVKLLVPGRVPAPTSYQNFVAPNKDFQVAGPAGWDVVTAYGVAGDSSSDSNVGGVKFKSGPAFIDLTTDSVASIRADILLNGAAPDALFGSQAGYEQRRSKGRVASILRNYEETKKPPFESAMGEAAIAEYTADGPKFGIGPKVHGYRATLVGGKVFALVNCQCPEADWKTLQPAFVTVINSVADGQGPPPPLQSQ